MIRFRPASHIPETMLRSRLEAALAKSEAEVLDFGPNEEHTGWRVMIHAEGRYARLTLAPHRRRWALTVDARCYHVAIVDDVLDALVDLVPFVLASIAADETAFLLACRLDRVTLHWARVEIYDVMSGEWCYVSTSSATPPRRMPVGMVRWSGPCELYRCDPPEALRLEDGQRRGAQALYSDESPHALLFTTPALLSDWERRTVALLQLSPGEVQRVSNTIWAVRAGHWTYGIDTCAWRDARADDYYKSLLVDRTRTPGVLQLRRKNITPYHTRAQGVSQRWDDAPMLRTLDDAQRASVLSPVETFASLHTPASVAYLMGTDLDAMQREIAQWAQDQGIKDLEVTVYPLDTPHALEQGDLLFVREQDRIVAYNVAAILKNQKEIIR